MATFTNSLSGVCDRVSARLGDQDSESWDKCQILTAVSDALWMLSLLRRDLFLSEIVIKLAADDCVQTLPEECSTLVSFKCVQVNGVRTPVTEGDFNTIETTALHPPSRRGRCNTRRNSQSTVVANYQVAVNPDNARTFAVSPIPTAGDEVCLIGDCVSITDFQENQDQEFPAEVRPYLIPLTELALYQLYSSDREVPEVAALANASLQAFINLTAITQGAVNSVLAQQSSNQ